MRFSIHDFILATHGKILYGFSAHRMENDIMNEKSPAEISREKLVQDFRSLMNDADELLTATRDDLGDRIKDARARLNDALDKAKASVNQYEDKAVAGAKATNQIIRDHPYETIGIAFGVGLLIGVLVNRR